MKKLFTLLSLFLCFASGAWAIETDGDGYYLIGSVQDWKDFATLVETTPNANAKLTADINLGDDQTKIGSESIPYKGTFDGQGYSLTVAYVETDGSSQYVAPFIGIQNATIQNLHVKGSVTTAGKCPAGLASQVKGTCYVRNCWSEVDITSSYDGEIGAGGLVAWVGQGYRICMDDCIFSGSITFSHSNGYRAGGLVGYCPSASAGYVKNCLFAPRNISTIKMDATSNRVFVSNYKNSEDIPITNCYYVNAGTSANWRAQGKEVQSSQLADGSLAYKLQAFREDLIWGQKLGTDAMPVPFAADESSRVYRINDDSGFTNDPAAGYVFHQDTDGYYIVGSLYDWQDFAELVETTPNANAKLTADINLGDDQTVVATTYRGTFDGQGHTLTVNLTATNSRYGLFCTLCGATIKNLHVTGTVTTSFSHTGGIVGQSYGTSWRDINTLINCWSSVTIRVTNNSDRNGGFVGDTADYDTLNMSDCLFDGSFDGAQSSNWGGFLGSNYYSTVNISNSLFAPTSIYIKDNLYPFYDPVYAGCTLTNCYTSVSGTVTQGLLVTADKLTNGDVAYLLQKGRNDLIWGQVLGTNTHPVLFGDDNSRVYSTADGGYTNDPDQAAPYLVFDFTIAANNGDITIKGFRSDFTPPADYALVIPDEICGYPVTAIDGNAFKQKSTITSLSIGRNVQTIGGSAFRDCTGIQSVIIPNNVTFLDDNAFCGCSSLSTVTFEEGCQLTKIRHDTFSSCTSLTGITIPSSVTDIEYHAFWNCTNLTSLVIPVNVTFLGEGICAYCSNLATLDLSQATQIPALYGMNSINRKGGIFSDIPAACDVILPYGCIATGDHVTIAEPDENSIGIAEDGYYELSRPEHWKALSAIVQVKPTANARMTADIDLGDDQTTMGPTEALAYKGTFDGQGYTLTVNISSTADICAPFRYVGDGAVIKNLLIAGTVNGAHRRIGGLVGEGNGTYSINNCISSVTINTTYNGDGIQGGFVASQRGTLQISDCIFDGVFYGPNAYTWGGIVGWKYNTTSISNCLVLCDSYNVKMTDVATFIPNDNNITNCYYKTAIGTAQGTQATEEDLASGTITANLQANREETVWVQDPLTNQPMLALFAGKYTVPASGLGTFSAKTNFTLPEGLEAYVCKTYDSGKSTISTQKVEGTIPANTGVLMKGIGGETYTLVASSQTPEAIEGNALIAVVEATHVDQTVGEYTNFMMSGGKFVKIAASSNPDDKMPANRAYLPILTSALPAGSGQSITVNWDEETGVKAVRDAQFMINSYYTLDGRKLNGAPSKGGIYINNGKKVIK